MMFALKKNLQLVDKFMLCKYNIISCKALDKHLQSIKKGDFLWKTISL